MDKAYAQSMFIKEAEEMGIPSVRWSRNMEPIRFEPPAYCPWPDLPPPSPPSLEIGPPPAVAPPILPPPVDHAAITWCPGQRRLLPRAASHSEFANVERRDSPSDKLLFTLWGGGLSMLSGMGLFLWMALRKHLGKRERGKVTITERSRVHARAWNII